MRNFFCILGLIGVILFVTGYYFVDNAKYAYISGIALMTEGFIGIKKNIGILLEIRTILMKACCAKMTVS